MASTIDIDALSSLIAEIGLNSSVDRILLKPSMWSPDVGSSHTPVNSQLTQGSIRPPLLSSLSVPLDLSYTEPLSVSTWVNSADEEQQGVDRRCTSVSDAGARPTPARYKTELCRPFEEHGTCRYGSKCQFAHGRSELRAVARHPKYKTDLCRTFHTTGLCPYGPRCHFIHNDEERRNSESPDVNPATMTSGKQQKEELARRRALVHSNHAEAPSATTKLQRQYSDRLPRPEHVLQRRASNVADVIIHNTVPSQYQLQTLAESVCTGSKATRSLGSAADSFSPSSSVTDSPSPSPTSGLLLNSVGTAMDDVTSHPTAALRAMGDEKVRALILELFNRFPSSELSRLLRPQPAMISPQQERPATGDWNSDSWTQMQSHQHHGATAIAGNY